MSKTPDSPAKPDSPDTLFGDIKDMIQSAKQRAAVAVNAELTLLYWQVGQRINDEVLKGERADYGKQIISGLSQQLVRFYGKGWSPQQLRHCVKFAEVYTSEEIVSTVWRQLSWSHLKLLIYIDDPLKREFYSTMAIQERWSVRTFSERMDSMLFERTALSRKPEETILHDLKMLRDQGKADQDIVLKDPYILDFLGLNDTYVEKDLEDAILREMEHFLLEMGMGFTFIARQHRVQIDEDDFYIDLLFYNRKLRRLVAIELKTGKFKAEYKGQMELYLRWLDRYDRQHGEEPPIGVILCAGKKQKQIELLELDKSGIHLADYLTSMPSKELLEERFKQAVRNARKRIENKSEQ
ncbi:PDDEXK nuclease domain-containing protein [Endozoicomonas euniceicola]|uniref:PDDEXK nuclease domain-containing protein n=1 Tax=Endozoicomonas euniceicola TaxID=1234143 RepID=A0ABY6GNG1_9GAMM|nr:PDDEXK nuclease domain-containing protein [Endozoicomonas euniceicola]UYM14057.1 PDDEXK nuclease domain-containing protein [Endozoicomonas euniceicola]